MIDSTSSSHNPTLQTPETLTDTRLYPSPPPPKILTSGIQSEMVKRWEPAPSPASSSATTRQMENRKLSESLKTEETLKWLKIIAFKSSHTHHRPKIRSEQRLSHRPSGVNLNHSRLNDLIIINAWIKTELKNRTVQAHWSMIRSKTTKQKMLLFTKLTLTQDVII